ncbi:4'-phosphopantetheinyl transferase family protein [Streptomyces purpureus]|uniref:4'-phosphopantetheinyl transferase n=1 Tax=Streptomyces purpureus TaxID=1951 RepID=A0A918H200_9ACTN|nr:4'-phosphopantetheinyl transferase superfamily protein [Streptomyces purpureus]GGT33502.1 4'-phosphopantetheinyl transferase [Streptomyces purpureus]
MSDPVAVVRPGECHVWTARAVSVPSPALLALLDEGERARYDAFLRDEPRALYLTAHALLRQVTAAQLGTDPAGIVFTTVCHHCDGTPDRPHGKPGLPDSPLELSLSHSGEMVAVALTYTGPVGVDIEQATTRGELPLNVLAAVERAELDRLPESERRAAFIRYWARKEAVLKATGDGLMADPATLTVSAPGRPAELLHWAERVQPHPPVRLYDVETEKDYRAAVAVLGDACRVVPHHVEYSGDGVLRRPR